MEDLEFLKVMSNLLDFDRLSSHIDAIVDRKLVGISSSVTSSTGFLRSLVVQSQGFAEQAASSSSSAQDFAGEADGSATASLTALNEFTSTYLGLSTADPQLSPRGNTVVLGGFYIRRSDSRLRYVSSLTSAGVPTYTDVSVSADPNSLAAAGAGVFLSVQTTSQQTVKSPVTFQSTVSGSRVSAWTSLQFTTALDVNERFTQTTNSIGAETARATAAENLLDANKVAKSGDVMSGSLTITASGETPAVIIRNNTSGSGRIWRLHSTNTGQFRIVDDTGQFERLTIGNAGEVGISAGLTVGTQAAAKNFLVNQTDTTDAGIGFSRSGALRWELRRSDTAQRFYIARRNAQGAFVDTPFLINESDGSIVMNRTTINDTLTATGSVTVNGVGASIYLNNTSASNDSVLVMRHNNVSRWAMGRSLGNSAFYINRMGSDGSYVDTPLLIAESTGNMTVGALASTKTISATTSVTAPIVYATANGTGRAVAIGDDAWIGDINVVNTMSVRGQADANAGFISFGNSMGRLGCNANDATLRYNDQIIMHTGNTSPDSWGFSQGESNGIIYVIRPAGNGKRHVTFSGSLTFNSENVVITVTYPFALETVTAFGATSFYSTSSVGSYHDTFSAFSRAPSTTQALVFVNKTSGDSVLPVNTRWFVEGIIS